MIPRLKTTYNKEIVTKLLAKLNLRNKHEVPKIEKIILNMGLGEDASDGKKIKSIGMIKKHLKPTKENKGGIVSKESFIHQSNVKNLDQNKKEKKLVGKKWYQD